MDLLIRKTDTSEIDALRRKNLNEAMHRYASDNSKVTCFGGKPGILMKTVADSDEQEQKKSHLADL